METLKNNTSQSTEISSSLLLTSLNFHGQELLTALQVEHADIAKNYVDTRCLNYVEYRKRAPQAELHLRSKRQRLLLFIARKADLLFKPVTPRTEEAEENEDAFAVLPPLEKYMAVPPAERRSRFLEHLKRGDTMLAIVRTKTHPPLGSNSRGNHFIATLLCFDGKKKRFIDDLLIKAEIIHGEYNVNDVVRALVYNYNPTTNKIVLATHVPEFSGNQRCRNLGKIKAEDLPKHYLLTTEDLIYGAVLTDIPSFNNPSCIENLCNYFNLPLVSCCTSLIRNLSSNNFSKSEYATELRKKQMSHWAMRSLREGENCEREDEEEELPNSIVSANNVLDGHPQNAESFVHRGAIRVSMEEFEQAIEDFKMALTYDTDNANAKKYLSDAHMMLGQKYAGIGNIDLSYENFNYAVEYNPSNKEAVDYLTAIMSVKVLDDAEKKRKKQMQSSIEEEEVREEPVITSPKDKKVRASVTTTTEGRPSTSVDSLQYSGTSYPGSFPSGWSGSSLTYVPSASWQNSNTWTTQSSSWQDTSSVWPNMSSSAWSAPVSDAFPAAPPAVSFPSTSEDSSVVHNTREELSLNNKSVESMSVSFEDQLKHMIEEERDRHVLKQSRGRSESRSSSVSSSSIKKKRHSSHRKKRRYKEESSDGEISSHSSTSSQVDEHRLKCEEFLERNRRQMAKSQSQSRETAKEKDVKEDGSSKKEHHRKTEHGHKKDCVKKLSKSGSKEHDKNLHKDNACVRKDKKQDSVSVTKEKKVNDSSSVKKDNKKNEEKVPVELSHVNEIDSEHEENSPKVLEIRDNSDDKVVPSELKKSAVIPVNIPGKKVVPRKKKNEKLVEESTSRVERSDGNFYLYIECSVNNKTEKVVCTSVPSVAPADASCSMAAICANDDDENTVVDSVYPETGQEKIFKNKKIEPNDTVPVKKKTSLDKSKKQTASSAPPEIVLFSDVSSDSSTATTVTLSAKDTELQRTDKSQKRRRHHSHKRKRSPTTHHSHRYSSVDNEEDYLDYAVANSNVERTNNPYAARRMIKDYYRYKKVLIDGKEAERLLLNQCANYSRNCLERRLSDAFDAVMALCKSKR